MATTSPRQRKTTGRVMHEFAHGELKSGPGGKGGKVKSRRQAIAIALKEAGASKYESKSENKKNLARTKHKEAHGNTATGTYRFSLRLLELYGLLRHSSTKNKDGKQGWVSS